MTATASGRVRLLYVLNDASFFVTHRLVLAVAAREAGYDVHVALPRDDRAMAPILKEGLPVHVIPLQRAGTNPFIELRTLAALIRLYRSLKPEIVHHVTAKPVLYGSLAARLTGVKGVVNAISGLGYLFMSPGRLNLWQPLVRSAYKLAFSHPHSRVILQNPDDSDLFVRSRILQRGQAVLIRGSGVDIKTFVPVPEAPGTPIVLLPARLLRHKGVLEFVSAARYLRGDGVNARFVLAGGLDVNPSAIGRAQIESWQADRIVEWWGQCDDMNAVLAKSAIVCLPSYREGLPKAILEAMACERAVITTDVPGCREAVRNGDNGILVPAGEWRPLAEAIRVLLDDPELRRKMAHRGRQRAVEEFRVEIVVGETLQLYRELAPPTAR